MQELERLTRNGYSPPIIKTRLDSLDRKVDDLDKKVDRRFDALAGQSWRIAMFIVGAMGVAAAIVGLVVR